MKKVTIAKMDRLWSEYIRARDKYVCCTCGLEGTKSEIDCGHLIKRGKKSVRFDPMNTFAQCKSCNIRHNHWPEYMTRFFITTYGVKEYKKLIDRSKIIKGWKSYELEELYEDTKNKLHALTEL